MNGETSTEALISALEAADAAITAAARDIPDGEAIRIPLREALRAARIADEHAFARKAIRGIYASLSDIDCRLGIVAEQVAALKAQG